MDVDKLMGINKYGRKIKGLLKVAAGMKTNNASIKGWLEYKFYF